MPFKSKAQERFMWAKHPKMAQEFADATPEDAKLPQHVKKMADGGLVGNEQDELYKYLLKQNDLPGNQPDLGMQLASADVPRGTVSSPTPPTPVTPVATSTGKSLEEMPNDDRIKDSNPGHSPQDVSGATVANETSIDKYGPDQQQQVLDSIAKSHGTLGNRLTRGAASIGDALMMNAGKNSPGFLNAVTEREARTDKMKAEATPQLQEMNMKNMGAKQSLEMRDPNSEISKAKRAGYEEFFKKLHYSPEKLAAMSAADMDTQVALMTQYGGDELKAEATKAQLENDTAKINAQIEQMKQTTENQQTQRELQATGELSKRGVMRRLMDFVHESPETSKLKEEAGIIKEPYLKTAVNAQGHRIGTKDGKTWEAIP